MLDEAENCSLDTTENPVFRAPWTCEDKTGKMTPAAVRDGDTQRRMRPNSAHEKQQSLFRPQQQLNKQNINTQDKDRVRGWEQGPSQGYLVTGSPCCPQSWRQYKAQVISEPLRSQVLVGQGSTEVTRTKEQSR